MTQPGRLLLETPSVPTKRRLGTYFGERGIAVRGRDAAFRVSPPDVLRAGAFTSCKCASDASASVERTTPRCPAPVIACPPFTGPAHIGCGSLRRRTIDASPPP